MIEAEALSSNPSSDKTGDGFSFYELMMMQCPMLFDILPFCRKVPVGIITGLKQELGCRVFYL
jgi:hypothetical protein